MQHPNNLSPWQAWSMDVQHMLQTQQQHIDRLSKEVAALYEHIKQLESRPSYTIESIQYHFDQLKVEKLDGTLNIGMTAPGENGELVSGNSGAIEQIAVPKPQVFPAASNVITPPSAAYSGIYAAVNQYLDGTAPIKLQQLEESSDIPLDPYHRRIIIEDIRKQMPARINYYLQKQTDAPNSNAAADPKVSEAQIVAKAANDADAALTAYINKLKANHSTKGECER